MSTHRDMDYQDAALLPDGRGLHHDLVVYETGGSCHRVVGNAICGWYYWVLCFVFMAFSASFLSFIIWMAQRKNGGFFSMPLAICAVVAFSVLGATVLFYVARRYRRWKASHIGMVAEFDASTRTIVFPDGWVVGCKDVLRIHLLRTGYADLNSLGGGSYCPVHQVRVFVRSDQAVATPAADVTVRRAILTVNGFGWHTRSAFRVFCKEAGIEFATTRVRRSRWPTYSEVVQIINIPMY